MSIGAIEAVRSQENDLWFKLLYLNIKPDAVELSTDHSIENVEILELQLDVDWKEQISCRSVRINSGNRKIVKPQGRRTTNNNHTFFTESELWDYIHI